MDQPEIPLNPSAPLGGNAHLEEQVRSLRTLANGLLVAILCFGLGLALYLYRQVTQLNGQVTEAKRVVADYQTNALPRIKWFVGNLQNYAKTNPDFNPILAKYGLLPTNTAPTPAGFPTAPAAAKK